MNRGCNLFTVDLLLQMMGHHGPSKLTIFPRVSLIFSGDEDSCLVPCITSVGCFV